MDVSENFRLTSHEKFHFYNTLSILIKAVVGQQTTIDLRNESFVYGKVEHTDAHMNVTMNNCFFTDPKGNTYKYDMFFVHTRNIRSVHIPSHIRIVPAITEELKKLKGKKQVDFRKNRTFVNKRAQEKHKQDTIMAKEILLQKNQNMPSTSKLG